MIRNSYFITTLIIMIMFVFPYAQIEASAEMNLKEDLITVQNQINELKSKFENIPLRDESTDETDFLHELRQISDDFSDIKKFLDSTLSNSEAKTIVTDKNLLRILLEINESNVEFQTELNQRLENMNSKNMSYIHIQNIGETNQLVQKQVINFLSKSYGSDSKAILQPSITKIKSVQYIWDPSLPHIVFEIRNAGKVPTENLDIFFTKLINTAEVRYLGSTDSFSDMKLTKRASEILNNDMQTIEFKLLEPIPEEGTYVGKISIIGDNFDAVNLDVEIESKIHPTILFLFTLLGFGIAIGLGTLIPFNEKKEAVDTLQTNEQSIIDQLNSTIINWNTTRHMIPVGAWNNITQMATQKRGKIIEHMKKKYLASDNNYVKWYNEMSTMLTETSLRHGGAKYANDPIDLSFSIPNDRKPNFHSMRILEARGELTSKKKIIYFISTVIISLPATFFVADTFVGWIPINLFIASSVGFGMYKIQDLRNLLIKKET